MRMLFRTLPIGLALLLAGCDIDFDDMHGGAREQEEFHYDYDFKPGSKLLLENYNGSVEITGWEQPKLEIHGTKFANTRERLQEVKIDIVRAADTVTVRTVRPLERSGNSGARYQIRVPRQAVLEYVKSTNGSVQVTSIDGPATIRTTNGAVRVSGIKGAVAAQSTNGTIECVGITGPVGVRTTNGRVRLEEIRGAMEAATTNGTIVAEMAQPGDERRLSFSTTNGSIELKLPAGLKNDVRASTSNGSISVRIPGNSNFNVSARTSGSSVRTDFAVAGETSKKRIDGKVGSGGPLLDLSTSNGHIAIEKSL